LTGDDRPWFVSSQTTIFELFREDTVIENSFLEIQYLLFYICIGLICCFLQQDSGLGALAILQ
jgi:hypothetical protein